MLHTTAARTATRPTVMGQVPGIVYRVFAAHLIKKEALNSSPI
jgi:hypothetical protein